MDGSAGDVLLASRRPARRSGRIGPQDVIDGLPDAVLILDDDLTVRAANAAASFLLGLPPMLPGRRRSLRRMIAPSSRLGREGVHSLVARCRSAVRDPGAVEVRFSLEPHAPIAGSVRPIGPRRWRLLLSDAQEGGAGAPLARDPLTGLVDRMAFRDALAGALARGGTPAVLMIDLDRFKAINDTLGHPVGDALLCSVAERMRSALRGSDCLARLGGDEFAVMMPNGAMAEAAASLAGRLVELTGRPFLVKGHLAHVGASIGIALAPQHGTCPDDLIRNADLALYQAKSEGGSAWRVFTEAMEARARARRELEQDLRRALAAQQFTLHYQPQFSLRSRTLTGFEALIRWPHPERGMVSPGDFIPLAEEIGLIVPLGRWVLRRACQDAARWPEGLSVAVNVSALQFERGDELLRNVAEALARAGLPGHRLELEVTESALLNAEQTTLRTLHALRELGVRIAMDDFGTGYSSLSQLRSFPFDKIKIDRSFVRDVSSSGEAAAIVRAINALGTTLGMTTIAEGVETDDQAAALLQDGCGDIQGYLISRPIPADAVPALIGRYSNQSGEMGE